MVRFIIVLALVLYSFNGYGSNIPQAVNMLQLAGPVDPGFPGMTVPLSTLPIIKTLTGASNTGTHSDTFFYNLYSGEAQGGYQAGGATGATCTGFYLASSAANVITGVQFGYGTALNTDGIVTPPAGVVYYNGEAIAGTAPANGIPVPIGATNTSTFVTFKLFFPTTTFPFIRVSNGGANFGVLMTCIEQ